MLAERIKSSRGQVELVGVQIPLAAKMLGRGPSPRRARRRAGARPRSAASPEASAAGVCAGAMGMKTPTAQPRLRGSSAPLGRPPPRAKPPPTPARPRAPAWARARPASSAAGAAPAPIPSRRVRRRRRRRARHVAAPAPSPLGRPAMASSAKLRRLRMPQWAKAPPPRCGNILDLEGIASESFYQRVFCKATNLWRCNSRASQSL